MNVRHLLAVSISALAPLACSGAPASIEVVARDYSFQAPDEIPSGWTTFRFSNEGLEHHFFLLTRLPDGKTMEDYLQEVVPAFEAAWEGLREGTLDKAGAGQLLGSALPEWYGSAVFMGGPGLVEPGGIVQVSVDLDPGTYLMECYVKTADGTFHTALGMIKRLAVTEAASGATPPEADFEITVSNDGITTDGEITVGTHMVAVHFAEHPEYGLGNDIHLVRLEEETDVSEVVRWMDWMEVDGLRAPAPASFLGGAQEMPVGSTAYFNATVGPGRYAWVVEAPAESGKWMEFTIE